MTSKSHRQIDFAKLKARISILDILEHYGWLAGLRPERDGERYVGCCPIHDGTGRRQFVVTPDRHIWKCFGDCDTGGDTVKLVAFVEGVSSKDAALMIADWFDITDCDREPSRKEGDSREAPRRMARQSTAKATREPVRKATPARRDEPDAKSNDRHNAPLGWKKLLPVDTEHEWFDQFRVLPDTLAEFGIGISEAKSVRGKAAIPIFNGKGELLAYAGRDIEAAEPHYTYPDNFTPGVDLYNLHRACASERYESDGLIIVPDFFDVVMLYELGYQNVVALMATDISAEQMASLQDVMRPGMTVRVLVPYDDRATGFAILEALRELADVVSTVSLSILPADLAAYQAEDLERLLAA